MGRPTASLIALFRGIEMTVNRVLMILTMNLIGFIAVFGVGLPFLVSYPSTEMVLLGLAILAIIPFVWWNLNKGWIKEVFSDDEKEDEKPNEKQ